MRLARKFWARLCLPFVSARDLSVGKNVQLAVSSRFRAGKNAVIHIGDSVNLAGNITVFGKLFVGKNVFIAPGTKIWVCENAVFSIGDFSKIMGADIFVRERVEFGRANLIAEDAMIHDNNGHSTNAKKREHWIIDPDWLLNLSIYNSLVENSVASAPVVFKDNVFLGKRCIVLKGVNIGENSVVGAGSIVTKNIPANSLAVGNPAKIVKKL